MPRRAVPPMGRGALPVTLLLAALAAVLTAPPLLASAGTSTTATTTTTAPTLERVAVLSDTAIIATSSSASGSATTTTTTATTTTTMTLTGTAFPVLPSRNITIIGAVQNVCADVVRVSSTEITCQYPVRGAVGCTQQKVTLSFNGVPARTTSGREGDSNRICYVDSFEEKIVSDKPRANPWETNWTFNIILIVSGGFASVLLCWLIIRWLVRCCVNCCGNGKYVPPDSGNSGQGEGVGGGGTKVVPMLHRIATCEDSLSELKLAKAAWTLEPPPPRAPPPRKSEESDIDQKLWSLTER